MTGGCIKECVVAWQLELQILLDALKQPLQIICICCLIQRYQQGASRCIICGKIWP